jgi:hypothetical protein
MPLAYVLDENLRGGALWRAIRRHNAAGVYPLDIVRVGDPPDLPRRGSDPVVLLWAEREGRILISRDVNTMPVHLADHLSAGHHSPGVFLTRLRSSIPDLVDALALNAYAGFPADFADQIRFIP